MGRKFVCSNCGCTEYFKVSGVGSKSDTTTSDSCRTTRTVIHPRSLFECNLSISGDAYGNLELIPNFEVLVCKECGKVELFMRPLNEDLKAFAQKKTEKEKELDNVDKQIKALVDEDKRHDERLDELKALLKSEDITVKQLNEYKAENESILVRKHEINKELQKLSLSKEPLKKELDEILWRIEDIERISYIEENGVIK